MNTVTLPLKTLTKEWATLSGVSKGRTLLAKLIVWTVDESPTGVLLIDFNGLPDASGSFLRESILAFRDYARAYVPDLFPVIANVSADIFEDFDLLLRQRGEAMLACRTVNGRPTDPVVIGKLDPALLDTLKLIRTKGPMALADFPTRVTKTTAWSNRLASLVRQGFVAPIAEANRRAYEFVLS